MAKDPYKYFRIEARELVDGLKQGALDLEKGASAELVARLLRLAHTLKGAARVVKLPSIAERAHEIEDLLEAHRDGTAASRTGIDALLELVDNLSSALGALAVPDDAPAKRDVPAVETVRIEVEEMDRLLGGLVEATVQLNALRGKTSTLDRAHRLVSLLADQAERGRDSGGRATRQTIAQLQADLADLRQSVRDAVEQVGAELVQVRDAATRLRLTPVARIFATLERAARDAAISLGKRVRFTTSGGETRLDAHVLMAVGEALLHVVRNAVAHGIATDGTVTIAARRRGTKVVFSCRDDGRGIDLPALRRVAIARGAQSDAVASDAALLSMLLDGGLTTAKAVNDVSGRGVGLDVVREIIARLKGEVRVRTGDGTTFELEVPVSLTSQQSLVVSSAGVTGSIALDAVRGTRRVLDADIARTAGKDCLEVDGNVIPFAPLARVLRRHEARGRRAWSAVVVQAGDGMAAIGVDRLVGTAEVVVRSLPAQLDADPTITGTSVDAEGNPELVFDPAALVAAVHASRDAESRVVAKRRPILVVDDSLTTRMLEQSILESAGYEVDVATSAEEALEKAASVTFGLFIVDVEMPGMDGFEFVARTRADASLRDTPAILVTSRASDEDKARGAAVGATAYIVKGEFDQALLLRTIREILG